MSWSVHTLWFCGPVSGTVTQMPSLVPMWPMPPPSRSEKLPHTQFWVTCVGVGAGAHGDAAAGAAQAAVEDHLVVVDVT